MFERVIDKVAWLRVERSRLLCARSTGKSCYFIPGGKREPGESDVETLAREIREELDVEILLESANFVAEFSAPAHGHAPGTVVNIRCYESDYIGRISASSEIQDVRWISYDERADTSAVDLLIFEWLRSLRRV